MSLDSASDELRETFKRALRRFPAAVSVITSADQDRRHGMTATAVTSLSLDPPSLIVCINQATLLHDIMLLARRFCVNVLRRDQVPLSSAFSGALPAETLGVDAPEKQRRTIRRSNSPETSAPWVPTRAAVAGAPGGGGWIPVPTTGRQVHPRFCWWKARG